MTLSPKEKAMELVASYWAINMEKNKEDLLQWMQGRQKYGVPLAAKQCALLCVEEIIESYPYFIKKGVNSIEYFQEVKAHLSRM
jgi:hypothetical protein